MENTTQKSFIQSKNLSRTMTGILLLVGIIFVFHIGEEFGYKKAELTDHMSDGYYKAFGPHDPGKAGPFGYLFDDQTDTHGVAGKVVAIKNNIILVADNEGIEKNVLVDKTTIIKNQRNTILIGDIKPNDYIIVIGTPTPDGQINAKIVRVLPPPNMEDLENSGTSTTPTN
ncbi:MAG: hypothetical protein WCO65_02445 [bacterium]